MRARCVLPRVVSRLRRVPQTQVGLEFGRIWFLILTCIYFRIAVFLLQNRNKYELADFQKRIPTFLVHRRQPDLRGISRFRPEQFGTLEKKWSSHRSQKGLVRLSGMQSPQRRSRLPSQPHLPSFLCQLAYGFVLLRTDPRGHCPDNQCDVFEDRFISNAIRHLFLQKRP